MLFKYIEFAITWKNKVTRVTALLHFSCFWVYVYGNPSQWAHY